MLFTPPSCTSACLAASVATATEGPGGAEWVQGGARAHPVAMAVPAEWQWDVGPGVLCVPSSFFVPRSSPSLSVHLFTHSLKRKSYNFPAQEMAFLRSVTMPTSSSCCFVEKESDCGLAQSVLLSSIRFFNLLSSIRLVWFFFFTSLCMRFCLGIICFIFSSILSLFPFLYLVSGVLSAPTPEEHIAVLTASLSGREEVLTTPPPPLLHPWHTYKQTARFNAQKLRGGCGRYNLMVHKGVCVHVSLS